MAHVYLLKIRHQLGSHKVRVESAERLPHVLMRLGVEKSDWCMVGELPDDDTLGLNSIWASK
jgi:hypothetical protein